MSFQSKLFFCVNIVKGNACACTNSAVGLALSPGHSLTIKHCFCALGCQHGNMIIRSQVSTTLP